MRKILKMEKAYNELLNRNLDDAAMKKAIEEAEKVIGAARKVQVRTVDRRRKPAARKTKRSKMIRAEREGVE